MNSPRTTLYRDKQNAKLMGVCSGLADYTGVNVFWLRMAVVIMVLITGFALPAYFIAGLLLDKKPPYLYADQDENRYWQRVRQSPKRTAREIRAKMKDVDRRLAEVETLRKEYAALEKDVLRNGNPVCFLSLQVSNLPELYMSFGIEYGDRLQRGIASMLSKTLPSPKYIFKFSDTTYIVILIAQQRSSALLLKQRLSQVFNKAPFFIDGQEIKLHTKLGMSCFPDNGKTLSQLIGTSLVEITSKNFFETTMST